MMDRDFGSVLFGSDLIPSVGRSFRMPLSTIQANSDPLIHTL